MSLYRCAACGSPNVVTDTQSDGYNYVKGAIGTIVLGAGGAVAGINGKTKQVYKCPDCGLTLNEPMDFETKTLIDVGVTIPASRNNLKLYGVSINWEIFISKYKNLEKDAYIRYDTDENSNNSTVTAPTEPEKTLLSIDEVDMNKRTYKVARATYVKACLEWSDKCEEIKSVRSDLIKEGVEQEKIRLLEQIEKDYNAEIKKCNTTKESIIKEKDELTAKLSSLGFFQFGEKKNTNNQITQLTKELADITTQIDNTTKSYQSDIKNIYKLLSSKQTSVEKTVIKKHPIPLKPKIPEEMLLLHKDGSKASGADMVNHELKEEIFRYIEKHSPATYSQIKNKCPSLADFTDSRIKGYISSLIKDFCISEINGKYRIVYTPNPEWSSGRLLSDDDLRAYEEYHRRQKEEREAAKKVNDETKKQILDIIKGKGKLTASDVRSYSSEFDTPKTTVLLRQLANDGIIEETNIGGRKHYEYK